MIIVVKAQNVNKFSDKAVNMDSWLSMCISDIPRESVNFIIYLFLFIYLFIYLFVLWQNSQVCFVKLCSANAKCRLKTRFFLLTVGVVQDRVLSECKCERENHLKNQTII